MCVFRCLGIFINWLCSSGQEDKVKYIPEFCHLRSEDSLILHDKTKVEFDLVKAFEGNSAKDLGSGSFGTVKRV